MNKEEIMARIGEINDQGYPPATPHPHEAVLVERVLLVAAKSVNAEGRVAPFRIPPFIALRIVRDLHQEITGKIGSFNV